MRARRLSFALAGLIVLSGAWANGGWVRAEQAAQPLTADQRIFGLAKIWSEAKCNFANFDLVPDLDWDKAFQEYLPKALAEQSNAEYYRLLQKFTALLKDGHTDISLPPGIRDTTDAPPVVVEKVENKAVILDCAATDELKGSGLSRGVELVKVDGRPVAEVLERDLFPFTSASTPQERDASTYGRLLRGPKGSRVVVEVRDLEGNLHTATLTRDSGTPAAQRFNRGRMKPVVEMRRFPGGIVYFALNSFGNERIVADFDQIFNGLADVRGMILDVRSNGGGNSGYGDAILARLTDKPLAGFLSKRRQRLSGLNESWSESGAWAIRPRGENPFLGALVVLTSRHTASAAEDFVVALHGNQRALVVGGKTMGTTGQPISFDLPGGGSARICAKKCLYPDGRAFVGVGIIPDVEVYPGQKDIAAGRDAVLEKALGLLEEKIHDTPRAEVAFKNIDPALAEGDYYRRRGQVSQAVRAYEEALRVQPDAAAAHLRFVDLYREQGDERKAAEHYQAIGFIDGSAWRLIGPFDNAKGTALDTPYAPEQGRDFAREYAGKSGVVRWIQCADQQRNGFVDFGSALRPNQWTVAYAATRVDSPAARDVQLRIGSDDEVKVWLNGNVVLNSNVPRYAAPDQDTVPVHLQAGRNDVLVKVCNRTGTWGFYLRVTDARGRPCADLRFSP
jgi:carboxyl-terminal processing protease